MNPDYEGMNDAELVELAKIDEGAFTALYHRYFDKIYRFIYKRVSHRETTEDLVSLVFEKSFLALERWKPQGYNLSAWLYRIAANVVIDHYRKASRRHEVGEEYLPESASTSHDATARLEQEEMKKKIDAVLQKLPLKYQQVISLKFYSELSYHEIAETMAITSNSVGVLLYRALKLCAKEMKKDTNTFFPLFFLLVFFLYYVFLF